MLSPAAGLACAVFLRFLVSQAVNTPATPMFLLTGPDVHAPNFLEDSELIVKGLPQLSIPCATITISSKHVLKRQQRNLVYQSMDILLHP